jgi:hypothetical protein
MSADWINVCRNLQEKLHEDPQFSIRLFFPKLMLVLMGRGSDDTIIQEYALAALAKFKIKVFYRCFPQQHNCYIMLEGNNIIGHGMK